MPNSLQQFIYNISALAPLLLLFAIVWFFQENTWEEPAVILGIVVLLTVLMKVAFDYGRSKLPPITIAVTDISTHDKWGTTYIISFCFPFVSMALSDYNFVLLFGISAIFIIIILFTKPTTLNIWLILIYRFHFYHISAENGVSGYLLISKRKIRNVKEVKKVRRVFEFLLEDVEGM